MPANRFTALLAGSDPAARRRAIKGLRRLGTAEAADALARALTDEDAETRRLAADALASIGPVAADAIVARLSEAGRPPDPGAVLLLGRLPCPASVGLLTRCAAARDPETRAACAEAFGELVTAVAADRSRRLLGGGPPGESADRSAEVVNPVDSALPSLLELLRDLDARVRIAAAVALGALGDERAVAPLLDELNDDDPTCRAAAAGALGRIGGRTACEELVRVSGADRSADVRRAADEALRGTTNRSVEPLVRMLDGFDPARRIEAMAGLLELGRYAVPELNALLKRGAPEARSAAAELLGRIGDSAALAPLAEACADGDPRVRVTAAVALGRIPGRRGAELLAPLLDADDPALAAAVADALERLGPSAIEPTMVQLGSRRELTRIRAVDVLGRLRHKGACERLIAGLGEATSWLRAVSAQALGEICEHRAAPALIAALGDRDALVRAMAAEALGKLAERDALAPLTGRLGDASDLVRAAVLRALGRIGDGRARPGLVAALDDPEPDIQFAAIEGLAALRAGPVPERLRLLARHWPLGRARKDVRRAAQWALEILASADTG